MKGKRALLAGAIFVSSILAYNCGGGGGGELASTPTIGLTATAGGVSGQSLTTLNTDNQNTSQNPQTSQDIDITLYKVELCSSNESGETSCTTIFENQNGVEIDLDDLDDSVFVIPADGVTPGDYTLKVYIGNTVIIDGTDTIIQCDEKDENNHCIYRTNVTITGNEVYVAFQYGMDNGSLNLSLKPVDPQQQPKSFKYYEVYGLLRNVDQTNNTITFEWNGNTYTARINDANNNDANNNDPYTTLCVLNDIFFGYECIKFTNEQREEEEVLAKYINSCLELYLDSNPAQGGTPGIFIIELAEPDDCGYPQGRDEEEYDDGYQENNEGYQHSYKYEYEDRYISFNELQQCVENENCTISIGSYQCSIPQKVFCEIETPQMEMEGAIDSSECIAQIGGIMQQPISGQDMDGGMSGMGGMMEIEVEYRMYNGQCEIYKIEAEYEYENEHDYENGYGYGYHHENDDD